MTWSTPDVLAAMRQQGQKHGGWMTMAAWKKAGYSPSAHVILHRFGHWRDAWRLAGFDVPAQSNFVHPRGTWTAMTILDALRQAATDGVLPPINTWRQKRYYPSVETINHYWGTYAQAAHAAGLRIASSKVHRQQRYQEAWDRYVAQLGRRPTQDEWNTWSERPASAAVVWRTLRLPRPRSRLLPQLHQIQRIDVLSVKDQEILQAYLCGETLQIIANHYGCTREAIRQRLQRITIKYSSPNKERVLDEVHC